MLSEEEIEKRILYAKSKFWEIKNREIREGIKILLEIIEQLESDKQDLIEELQEKEIKINELEDRISLIEIYYDISDLDEIVKNDI